MVLKEGGKEKEDAAAAQITSITVEENSQWENHSVGETYPVILKRSDNQAIKLKMDRILWSSAKIFWTKNYWKLSVARGFIASYFLMLEEGSLSSSNSFGSYGSAKSRWAA